MVSFKGAHWVERRDEQAAARFLTKAPCRHGVPEKIAIDGSEATGAAPGGRQP
jgi:transposase-like protein